MAAGEWNEIISIDSICHAPAEQKWLWSAGYKGDGYWMFADCGAVAASGLSFYTGLIEFFICFICFV